MTKNPNDHPQPKEQKSTPAPEEKVADQEPKAEAQEVKNEGQKETVNAETRSEPEEKKTETAALGPPKEVFLISCSKEKMNQDCIKALNELGFNLIRLDKAEYSQQPIEQIFKLHPKVIFAVVLLSGDDFVYDKEKGRPANAKLRITQDAAFKLGFLVSRLGSHNTFILYHEQKSFFLPTGKQNAIFTVHDKLDEWRDTLKKRLKMNGFDI